MFKTFVSPCRSALGFETGFPLWGEDKARIRAFFFRAWRFRFFSGFIFFALSRSFFGFALASAKKAPAPTSVKMLGCSEVQQ
jgi:hypothetical protein